MSIEPEVGEYQPDLILDSNECVDPKGNPLLGEMITGLDPCSIARYPDPRPLERDIAATFGVAAERVLVTAGADEAIDRVCRAFLRSGDRFAVALPTFSMIPVYVDLADAELVNVPWRDGPFPVDALIDAGQGAAVVAVVSPNNPTGTIARLAELEAIARAFPDITVMVDLAYVEFADEDPTERLLEFDNVILTRTFSKALGLAGLRVGYALGSVERIAALRAAGGPFSVAGVSLELAQRAWSQRDRGQALLELVRSQRDRLADSLRANGWGVPESQANFVLARGEPRRVEWLADGLRSLGVVTRRFRDDPGCLRITIPPNEAQCGRLLRAVAVVDRPQVLLFDLDGVLADVSRSYRVCISDTAAAFGVDVGAREIGLAKQEADANDDWRVTHRLIQRGGVEATLEEVTDRFEQAYQGVEDRPGRWRDETLIPTRADLERWAKQLPLAIVTGRPRQDAERFLEQWGVRDLFQAVVCREDSQRLKPAPDPVLWALELLDAERAWMVGDTRDDVAAARTAGVVPFGIVAPGSDPVSESGLFASGPARVFTQLDELEELLPWTE